MRDRSNDRLALTKAERFEWRPVPGFPDYLVSRFGVWSNKRGKLLKANPSELNPYPRVCLRRDGKSFVRYIHHLVFETFYGKRVRGMHVRHIDGDPMNFSPENLALGTPKENMGDKRRHGTHLYGERHPNAKLNENQVAEMREHLADAHMSRKQIANLYDVSLTTVHNIEARKTWNHV